LSSGKAAAWQAARLACNRPTMPDDGSACPAHDLEDKKDNGATTADDV
jgi:hypothetical protein